MRRKHESLMTALPKEGLAEGQLRSREVHEGRKPMAKCWPDGQKLHTRRTHRMRGPISSKSKVCTEGVGVNAAGISVKAVRHTRGDLRVCPKGLQPLESGWKYAQKSAEVIVASYESGGGPH